MSVETWIKGSTVPIWSFNHQNGTEVSPDQGVKVTLTDPDGTAQVDDQSMTEDEEGDFVYYYTTDSDSVAGLWLYTCTSQDGTGASAKYLVKAGSFWLE